MIQAMKGILGSTDVIPYSNLVGWYKFEQNLDDSCRDFTPQNGVQGYGDGIEYAARAPGSYGITNTHTGTVDLGTASKWYDLSGANKAFTLLFLGITLDTNSGVDLRHIFGHYRPAAPFEGFGLGLSFVSGVDLGYLHYYTSTSGAWTKFSGINVPSGGTTPKNIGIAHGYVDGTNDTGYAFIDGVYSDFTKAFPPTKPNGVNTTLFCRSDNIGNQVVDTTTGEVLIFNAKLSKTLIDAIIAQRMSS